MMIVESEYRINIYLDTNILMDYVEGNYPLLNQSIDYLSQCGYVTLRSSHYVLYEYTEARKYVLFKSRLSLDKKTGFKRRLLHLLNLCPYDNEDSFKAYIKRTWKYHGIDYSEIKSDIMRQVIDELDMFRDNLGINFDEHVLHERLVSPTSSLCLSTKISKEDCLVMVSCVYPTKEDRLQQCILLSRDNQYYKAFNANKFDVEDVFQENKLAMPNFIKTSTITGHRKTINLYDKSKKVNVKAVWNDLIIDTLKDSLGYKYIGETYLHGKIGTKAAECVYFKMDDKNAELLFSDGLLFISKNLDDSISLSGPFEYWNDSKKINLPFRNPSYTKYSFLPSNITKENLEKLRSCNYLVFYDGL